MQKHIDVVFSKLELLLNYSKLFRIHSPFYFSINDLFPLFGINEYSIKNAKVNIRKITCFHLPPPAVSWLL